MAQNFIRNRSDRLAGMVRTSQSGKSSSQPVCNECGGLECLCRPRFFAGQLLKEDDLNRLDQYIVKKQRLHNRYLHGWGIACGLELHCDPCDNNVIVTSGYALSPCGADIVVSQDKSVDVCELIQQCLREEQQSQSCEPYHGSTSDCEGLEEEWLLMIRYEEKPSRGITPLRNPTAEANCHPCGTVSNCDNSNANTSSYSHNQSARPQPAQCEPTIVCEGYRFEVCRVLPDSQDKTPLRIKRYNDCVAPLHEFSSWFIQLSIGSIDNFKDEAKWKQFYCHVIEKLTELLRKHSTRHCTLQKNVQNIQYSHRIVGEHVTSFDIDIYIKFFFEVLTLGIKAFSDCACLAWLPTCEAVNDSRIVLGKFTVNKDNCSVRNVCNWVEERKMLNSFPNFEYLGFFDGLKGLYEVAESSCCNFKIQNQENDGAFSSGRILNTNIPPEAMMNSISASKNVADIEEVLSNFKVQQIDTEILNNMPKNNPFSSFSILNMDSPEETASLEKQIKNLKNDIEKINKKISKSDS